MLLAQLLDGLEYSASSNIDNIEINSVSYDSRDSDIELFICLVGAKSDGHNYAEKVYSTGTRVFVACKKPTLPDDAVVIEVSDTRYALAVISANLFGNPSRQLKIIGVTGTKGKTSVTHMLKSILEASGIKTGLIGTNGTFDGSVHAQTKNTTPESYELQRLFRAMLDNGCTYCVMEVSSQATKLNRVAGITFEASVYTNIEPDHIGPGEHKDFDEYLLCKAAVFSASRHSIFNSDDIHWRVMAQKALGTINTYAIDSQADFTAHDISLKQSNGLLCTSFIFTAAGQSYPVNLNSPGKFSVYNALAALSVAAYLKLDLKAAIAAVPASLPKGRMELLNLDAPFSVIVDYAHNAMSLESILTSLKQYNPSRIVTLFGCGGDRDPHRRFEMGEVSGRLSDFTVITSDNPRSEDPETIIDNIITGIKPTDGKYISLPDRRQAIAWALSNAESGDIILIAGKGHEDYQEIKGVRYPFDDSSTVYDIAKELGIKKTE